MLAGCAEISGLDGLEVCDGACTDATADVPVSPDSSSDSAPPDVKEETTSDASIDAPIIVDALIDSPPTLGCKSPNDCQNGFCCGTVTTQGTYPQCKISTVSSKCSATCTSTIGFQKCTTDTLRLCTTNTDCTEQFFNRCCAYPYGNNMVVDLCSPPSVAEAGGATCQ